MQGGISFSLQISFLLEMPLEVRKYQVEPWKVESGVDYVNV